MYIIIMQTVGLENRLGIMLLKSWGMEAKDASWKPHLDPLFLQLN
jgi:hypothetical protein